ncbi:head-to-tail adaptor [Gordonia phage BaxterFox]|uniref:Head-to-tail adaptor n=2 Tax=Baxterfoxvirus TaxID=3044672 RepID=A0A7G8LG65_9CAUD|nr:head-to-tail adaptor [Gordonia phage BaxterFox]YP_010653283.1 head-tail adaptor Ad1 [Gordonia phage Ohgeesy]AMS03818.1 head-to-tail adaptor [Gordonia phage BaxterFox]QNJ56237.1 head-to-tail adaptor [Gordonia phage Ohgeesy]
MSSYAEPADIQAQWRTLTLQETARATALLDMAAILIDRHVTDVASLPDGHWKQRVAKQVSIDMVVDALESAVHRGGLSAHSVQVDDAVESRSYRDGDYSTVLVFTAEMRAMFGIASVGPSWRFG